MELAPSCLLNAFLQDANMRMRVLQRMGQNWLRLLHVPRWCHRDLILAVWSCLVANFDRFLSFDADLSPQVPKITVVVGGSYGAGNYGNLLSPCEIKLNYVLLFKRHVWSCLFSQLHVYVAECENICDGWRTGFPPKSEYLVTDWSWTIFFDFQAANVLATIQKDNLALEGKQWTQEQEQTFKVYIIVLMLLIIAINILSVIAMICRTPFSRSTKKKALPTTPAPAYGMTASLILWTLVGWDTWVCLDI